MAEAILRKWQSRCGSNARIGIAYQRQNGMVKRRSRKFNPPLSSSISMCRQNFLDQFALSVIDELLIVHRKSPPFAHQSSDLRLRQKEFVEPGNLRKYLQVCNILRLEIFVSLLGRRARPPKAFPEFGVTRIAPDQV